MPDVDEAGNDIIDALKTYSDWAGLGGSAPETITIPTKREGHPLGWLEDIEEWPGLFIVPLGFPTNIKQARQYQHTFSVAIYLVVAWEASTEPYQEARTQLMQVKRNIVGARAETGSILGLSYLADEVWRNMTPENELARWLREHDYKFACASMAFDWVTWSDSEDTG